MKQQKMSETHDATPLDAPFGNAFGASMAEALGRGASMLGRRIAAIQQENLRFMNQRLEDNMTAASEIGNCKSLPDLLAFQQKWFATMTRAYADEWHRYNLLMTDIVRSNGEVPDQDAAARGARPRED
jgi:hypothetical protein